MKKNQIRGATLALIIVMFCLSGCTTAKLTRSRQSLTQTEQAKSGTTTGVAEQQVDKNLQKTEELLQGQTITTLTREGIPESEAKVDVPIQNLLDLPDGAGYTAKDGQAQLSVQRYGDNIMIIGKCDSIARQCFFYEREVFRQRSEADSLKRVISHLEQTNAVSSETYKAERDTAESIKKKPSPTWYKWLLVGFVTGLLFTSPLRKLKNKILTF